jgi:hypothetical protein
MRVHLLVCLRALLRDPEPQPIARDTHVQGLEAKAAMCVRTGCGRHGSQSVASGYQTAALIARTTPLVKVRQATATAPLPRDLEPVALSVNARSRSYVSLLWRSS